MVNTMESVFMLWRQHRTEQPPACVACNKHVKQTKMYFDHEYRMLGDRESFSLAIMCNYGKVRVVDFWSSRHGPLGTYRLKNFNWSGQNCRFADKKVHIYQICLRKLHTKETNDSLGGYIPFLSIFNHSWSGVIEIPHSWWRHQMSSTFSALLALCYRWISLTKTSDAELWCFPWSAPEQTAE